jgi:hypothetical protein
VPAELPLSGQHIDVRLEYIHPRKPNTLNIFFAFSGPGLVTGAADDDPSGIATYSQAGAQFGYGLLWTVFLTTSFMIAIQLVSASLAWAGWAAAVVMNITVAALLWSLLAWGRTLLVATAIVERLEAVDPKFPKFDEDEQRNLAMLRAALSK